MSPTVNLANGLSVIMPAAIAFSHSVFNSSTEPMHIVSSPSSVVHIGIGIPQYLDLERFQSFAFSNQFPNLPVPVEAGFQLIVWFNSTILFLTFVALINQLSSG